MVIFVIVNVYLNYINNNINIIIVYNRLGDVTLILGLVVKVIKVYYYIV
jgi:hypothetical protein